MTEKNKGILLVVAAAAMFSTSGFLIKAVTADAFTVAFLRAAIGGVAFIPFIKWKRIFRELRGKPLKNFAILTGAYILLTLCYVNATKMTTSANAIILQCTAPLWLYLYYLITRKKSFDKNELLPRLAILAGVIIILADPINLADTNTDFTGLFGIGLAILSGIWYALEQQYMEKDYPMDDISKIGLLNLLMSVVMMIVCWNKITIVGLPVTDWLMLAFLGVFQIGIPYALLFAGIRRVSAFEASVLVMVEPILNPIWVAVFIGEVPTTYSIMGFACIFGGVMLSMLMGIKREKSTPDDAEGAAESDDIKKRHNDM